MDVPDDRPVPFGFGTRRAVAAFVVIAIALVHLLRIGSRLPASSRALYYGYFSDIVIPFGAYFLLDLQRHFPVPDWRVKCAIVLGAACFAETMQRFGVPVLGRTFDPLDYLMYAAGVLVAVLLDRLVLARLVRGWDAAPGRGTSERDELS